MLVDHRILESSHDGRDDAVVGMLFLSSATEIINLAFFFPILARCCMVIDVLGIIVSAANYGVRGNVTMMFLTCRIHRLGGSGIGGGGGEVQLLRCVVPGTDSEARSCNAETNYIMHLARIEADRPAHHFRI